MKQNREQGVGSTSWTGKGEPLVVSRLIYGAWRLADDSAGTTPAHIAAKIKLCLELGITTFDHADIYGDYRCEKLFGAAMAELSPSQRQRLQLVSKCGIKLLSEAKPEHGCKHYDTSREHITHSVEASLQNLRAEHLDLLLIHRPDPLMEADEVAEAFTALQRQGKVQHFGVSNFTPAQFELLASRLPQGLIANQIEFSPMALQALTDGTLDHCQQHRILPMAWSPLGGGRLASGQGLQEIRVRAALQLAAFEHGEESLEAVALAWILRHPARPAVIIGTQAPERIKALAAGAQLHLSREQWHMIWSAAMGVDVP